ncbi:hypothetical protein [Thermopetrobacter sp. TC1]|uniref:hypothetical protein n=1 Tax=Thermopetrobacter sp. TC1 TaxID=1495045 RepID=UPI0012E064A1|nr:hypothetical protein [Thermopetrobacter sp. TC1]
MVKASMLHVSAYILDNVNHSQRMGNLFGHQCTTAGDIPARMIAGVFMFLKARENFPRPAHPSLVVGPKAGAFRNEKILILIKIAAP